MVFKITICSRPLFFLGYAIFSRFNACKFLSIPEDVLRKWLQVRFRQMPVLHSLSYDLLICCCSYRLSACIKYQIRKLRPS